MGARVIVITSGKGGVGKTTTTANIGAGLAEKGHKVLLIDTDIGLRNLDVVMGLENRIVYDLVDVIEEKCRISQAFIKDKRCPNLVLLPAAQIRDKNDVSPEQMKNLVDSLKTSFDYILIDCPPSLGILTLNGLAAADEVFIPLQCEYFALEGLTLLLQTVKRVQEKINPRLKIGGIFFTMYDSRTKLAQEVVQQVTAYFKDRVCSTIIPRNVRLSEAPSHGLPICKYDDSCIGARSYAKLAQEVLDRA